MTDPNRTPVIIGVGQIADRERDPAAALDTVGLMAAALREAEKDAGGDWLSRLESLFLVDHLSFRDAGSAKTLAQQRGVAERRCARRARVWPPPPAASGRSTASRSRRAARLPAIVRGMG
jgi:acetyl-CoA C-acetyltransferase